MATSQTQSFRLAGEKVQACIGETTSKSTYLFSDEVHVPKQRFCFGKASEVSYWESAPLLSVAGLSSNAGTGRTSIPLLREQLDLALLNFDQCFSSFPPQTFWSQPSRTTTIFRFQNIQPRLAHGLGSGYTTVRHASSIAGIYDSDLFQSLAQMFSLGLKQRNLYSLHSTNIYF